MSPGGPTRAALEVERLSKWYGSGALRFRALREVSLHVDVGEAVAIVGRSGSGKSTLMHLLALLDSPDEGVVRVLGEDVASLSRSAVGRLRNNRFGFVFQQFFLTPNWSVLENVTLPLTIAGVGRRERRERGMAVLERLGLADKAANRATDLSGGQKQRVAISRALVCEPDVIFADEPTGNLDSGTGSIVEEELFTLSRERGATLVVVTHDEALAARCDRQVHLLDGSLQPGEALS